jgi:hypothetical protein
MRLKRTKKADLSPLILHDVLFPNSNLLQSVGAISVEASLRPSPAAGQIKVELRKNSQQRHKFNVRSYKEKYC